MTGQQEVEEEHAFTLFDDAPVKDETDWSVVLLGQAEEFPLYIEPQRVWCAPVTHKHTCALSYAPPSERSRPPRDR